MIEALPWIALILVWFGAQVQILYLSYQLSKALGRAQTAKPSLAPVTPPVSQGPPPVLPKPVSLDPVWFTWAMQEIGFHETGNNQGLDRYISLARTGANGEPWCAIFQNAALEANGIPGTRSPSSQSFTSNANFVKLDGPAKGCIVVYWRISRNSGQGHVGMYVYEDATRIWTLGGNEDNMVQIEALPKNAATFGLVGYYWPASIPLPTIGAIPVPAGTATSIQKKPSDVPSMSNPNPLQTNIVATVFGSQENDNRSTAYGGKLDDNTPGVALPFHFPDPRPRVIVTNVSNGKSVECVIADVGPWNINDQYWKLGTRPQSETGFDLGQTGHVRKTNKAGIDLTLAAAKALSIDGKGLVNWQFVQDGPKVS